MEEHLSTVYEEYKKFCVLNGKSYDHGLTIKKMDCSNIKALHENTKTQQLNNNNNMLLNPNINYMGLKTKNLNNLEEEFPKMRLEKPIDYNENNLKDFPNFMIKKPSNSEPFYPTINKTPPNSAFNNDQSFYSNPNNKNFTLNNKNPNNNMLPQNNFNNYNNQMATSYMNYGAGLPLNNLYQNNNSINTLLKELNITEEEIKKMIEDRNKARREQNFIEADRIRNYLKIKGIALMDEKGGRGKGTEVTTWKICKLNFNNQKNGEVSYNNGNAYYNEEVNNGSSNTYNNGKYLKFNP